MCEISVYTKRAFTQEAKRTGLTPEDIRAIENEIMQRPTVWPVMAATGGLRKMRFALAARRGGKSGGLRVCYFLLDEFGRVYLITVFAKNEKSNLSNSQCHIIKTMLDLIKAGARKEIDYEK